MPVADPVGAGDLGGGAGRAVAVDVDLLAARLAAAADRLADQPATRELRLGYFGASTGAAAALVAAAQAGDRVGAVVCAGRGHPAGRGLVHPAPRPGPDVRHPGRT